MPNKSLKDRFLILASLQMWISWIDYDWPVNLMDLKIIRLVVLLSSFSKSSQLLFHYQIQTSKRLKSPFRFKAFNSLELKAVSFAYQCGMAQLSAVDTALQTNHLQRQLEKTSSHPFLLVRVWVVGAAAWAEAQTSLSPATASIFWRNTEAFSSQPRDIMSPACPGSGLGPPSDWACQNRIDQKSLAFWLSVLFITTDQYRVHINADAAPIC